MSRPQPPAAPSSPNPQYHQFPGLCLELPSPPGWGWQGEEGAEGSQILVTKATGAQVLYVLCQLGWAWSRAGLCCGCRDPAEEGTPAQLEALHVPHSSPGLCWVPLLFSWLCPNQATGCPRLGAAAAMPSVSPEVSPESPRAAVPWGELSPRFKHCQGPLSSCQPQGAEQPWLSPVPVT